jgi:hypothetical protein
MPLYTRIAILFTPIALLGGTVSFTEIIDPEMPYVYFISPRDGATLRVPSSVASASGIRALPAPGTIFRPATTIF